MTMPPAAKTAGADTASIKLWPLLLRQPFGNLSDDERVLLGLGISADKNPSPEPPDDVSDAPP